MLEKMKDSLTDIKTDSKILLGITVSLKYISGNSISNFEGLLKSKTVESSKVKKVEERNIQLECEAKDVENAINHISPLFSVLPALLKALTERSKVDGMHKLPTKLTVFCSDCIISITKAVVFPIFHLQNQNELKKDQKEMLFNNIEILISLLKELILVKRTFFYLK